MAKAKKRNKAKVKKNAQKDKQPGPLSTSSTPRGSAIMPFDQKLDGAIELSPSASTAPNWTEAEPSSSAEKRDSVMSDTWKHQKQPTANPEPKFRSRWRLKSGPNRWWPCRTTQWCRHALLALFRASCGPHWFDWLLTLLLLSVSIFVGYIVIELVLTMLKVVAAQGLPFDTGCSVLYVTVPGPIVTVSLIGTAPTNPFEWINSIAPSSRFNTLVTDTPEGTPVISSMPIIQPPSSVTTSAVSVTPITTEICESGPSQSQSSSIFVLPSAALPSSESSGPINQPLRPWPSFVASTSSVAVGPGISSVTLSTSWPLLPSSKSMQTPITPVGPSSSSSITRSKNPWLSVGISVSVGLPISRRTTSGILLPGDSTSIPLGGSTSTATSFPSTALDPAIPPTQPGSIGLTLTGGFTVSLSNPSRGSDSSATSSAIIGISTAVTGSKTSTSASSLFPGSSMSGLTSTTPSLGLMTRSVTTPPSSSVFSTMLPPMSASSLPLPSSSSPRLSGSATSATLSSSSISRSTAPTGTSTLDFSDGTMTIQTDTTIGRPSAASTVRSAGVSGLSSFQIRDLATKVISYGDQAISFIFPAPTIRTTVSYWTGFYPTVTGPLPSYLQTILPTTRSVRQMPLSALPSYALFSSKSRSRTFKTVITTIYDDDDVPSGRNVKRAAQPQTIKTVSITSDSKATPTPAEMSMMESPGPTSCGESGNFTLNFDDTVVGSNDNSVLSVNGLTNPYHHLFYANGYTDVPDKWEPYPAISQPNVAMFLPLTGRLLASQPFSGTLLPGEIGAGPRASVDAYWFNAYSGYFGCALNGVTPCLLRISGYRYDQVLKEEVVVAEQNVTIPACWGYIGCRLTQVSFTEQFRALSGIQFNAYTAGLGIPQVHMVDDLQMGWYNNTCSAGILRIGHR